MRAAFKSLYMRYAMRTIWHAMMQGCMPAQLAQLLGNAYMILLITVITVTLVMAALHTHSVIYSYTDFGAISGPIPACFAKGGDYYS